MPKFVIERILPGSDCLSAGELQEIAKKSCDVLCDMGPEIQWVQSYVTANKWYCVYIAPNAEMIREHARLGGFPANAVNAVLTIVDPVSAEAVPVEN